MGDFFMENKNKYLELKENSEYERVVGEYNNHYGYDLSAIEHRCFGNSNEKNSHLNLVNGDNSLKKR